MGQFCGAVDTIIGRRTTLNLELSKILPPGTEVIISPHEVAFRTPTSYGDKVVRVFILGEPRLIAFNLSGVEMTPASLWLSEIELFIKAARLALGTPLPHSEEAQPKGDVR